MLLGKNFDDISIATIRMLVDAGATETVHLDFKRETYGNSDSDKKEFLKDISSFANTLGGHLVIGIGEEDGAASALTPISGLDVDQEMLRLESTLRTGIEPTIVGLRMKRVVVTTGSLIIIHVPRSFNPPHRVIHKGTNRYYGRNSAGAHELSMDELRMLFGEQRSIEERAKSFIGERFLRVQGNDGAMPIPIVDGVLVMHLVPLPDFGARRRIEIAALQAQNQSFVTKRMRSMGFSSRINLDGYCVYSGGSVCKEYTQIFRDGSIEATSVSLFQARDGGRFFSSFALPKTLIDSLNLYMHGLRMLEATPPILLQISAMAVNGIQMGVDPSEDTPPPYERESLHLPPSMITEFKGDGNYESVIAEQMDFLWNVFNFERCFGFSETGKWIDK